MPYTYEQFVSAANGAGMLDKFSEEDMEIAKLNPEFGMSVLKLQQDIQGARTTEQKMLAQEAINQIRKSYGTNQNNAALSFLSENQTDYQKALNEMINQEKFRYDPATDPSYGALKKAYLREGDRAREDTLAKVSAATGGTPSSFAVTAAQQAGDYYSGKLADATSAMEQNAYQRYLDDLNQAFRIEQDKKAQEQQAFENALALYNTLGYATPEVAEILGIGGRASGGSIGNGVSSGGIAGAGIADQGTDQTTGGTLLDNMMEELPEDTAPENYTVTNRNGNGWVEIGGGRMTWTELERAVNQGRIVEMVDPVNGTVTYKYASANTSKNDKKEASGMGGGGNVNIVSRYDALK